MQLLTCLFKFVLFVAIKPFHKWISGNWYDRETFVLYVGIPILAYEELNPGSSSKTILKRCSIHLVEMESYSLCFSLLFHVNFKTDNLKISIVKFPFLEKQDIEMRGRKKLSWWKDVWGWETDLLLYLCFVLFFFLCILLSLSFCVLMLSSASNK